MDDHISAVASKGGASNAIGTVPLRCGHFKGAPTFQLIGGPKVLNFSSGRLVNERMAVLEVTPVKSINLILIRRHFRIKLPSSEKSRGLRPSGVSRSRKRTEIADAEQISNGVRNVRK